MTRAIAVALVALAAAACSKDDAKGAAPSSSSSGPAGSASVTAGASSAPPAAPAGPVTWAGKYTAAPGAFYVPDAGEWSGVKFRGDDAGTGLGDGTLKVTIDPGGRAHGSLEGPLGPLRVDGEMRDSVLSARLTPADPASGFSGMLIGRADGGKIAGTMKASLPTANVIREASFSLEKPASK
jgi:hypothetical protein